MSDLNTQHPVFNKMSFWNDAVWNCPVANCESNPMLMMDQAIQHLSLQHGITIINLEAVIPFLDKYVSESAKSNSLTWGVDDHALRARLQHETIKEMLRVQDLDRQPRMRNCLFCRNQFQLYSCLTQLRII